MPALNEDDVTRTSEQDESEYQTKLAALRAAIDEGIASGIAEGDLFAQIRAARGLPQRSRKIDEPRKTT